MAIETRNPVVAPKGHEGRIEANMKRPLPCLDFDEHGKDRGTRVCRKSIETGGDPHFCPNKGDKPGKCQMGAFLYPRGLRPDGTTHFHQGIDLSPHYDGINSKKRHRSDFESDPDGESKPRADIVSVVAGKVVNKPEETGTGSYGLMVVIKANDPLKVDGEAC